MILSTIKKLSMCMLMLACGSLSTAYGQTSITSDSFVQPFPNSTVFLNLGQSLSLTGQAGCGSNPDVANAVMNFYASTTPNTQGVFVGSYTLQNIGFVWTPAAAGDYYVSAYLVLNGVTTCSGVTVNGPITGGLIRVQAPPQ